MKRILLVLVCMAMTGVTFAQSDTLASQNGVNVMRGANQSELMFEVCGYGITLGQQPFRRSPRVVAVEQSGRAVQWGIGFSRMEFGFSLLTGPSYAGYPASEHDFLDQRIGKSIHFGFRFLKLGVALNRQRNLYFRTGIHLMCDNYVFSQNITLRRDADRIVPLPLDKDYKKSKLMTAALGIPLQFSYSPVRRFSISVLAYGDAVINSHLKYKKPKQKGNFNGVNALQCGVGMSVSFRGVGLYAKYGLTSMFRNGVEPKIHPVTVGICFGR